MHNTFRKGASPMAGLKKYARTTISVPPELKAKMDAVTDEINWSALACRAFEDKLADLVAKQVMRDRQDVITRLRASKRRTEDEHYQEGQKAGRAWAEATAEAGELQRLENWQA